MTAASAAVSVCGDGVTDRDVVTGPGDPFCRRRRGSCLRAFRAFAFGGTRDTARAFLQAVSSSRRQKRKAAFASSLGFSGLFAPFPDVIETCSSARSNVLAAKCLPPSGLSTSVIGAKAGAIATAGSRILVDGSDLFAVQRPARPAAPEIIEGVTSSPGPFGLHGLGDLGRPGQEARELHFPD